MSARQRALMSLMFLFLGGCAIAPGMHMDESRYPQPGGTSPTGEKEPDVTIIPIDPQLLGDLIDKKLRPVPRANDALMREMSGYEYRVGPRDVLQITLWGYPELNPPPVAARAGEAIPRATNEVPGYVVSADGAISLPFVGTVSVTGKSIPELRKQLAQILAQYLKRPDIDVRVAAFRSQSVNVVGEVAKPGPIPISDLPLTALEAVNLAVSKPDADLAHVTVVRDGKALELDLQSLYDAGDTTQNRLLRDGDIVHVPDRLHSRVFVLGETLKPSAQPMHKGRLTLAEAVSDAGGPNPITSNPSKIYVIRGDYRRPSIYRLDASSPDALVLATHFDLKPLDVVYVSTAEVTRWNRVITQLLPIVIPSTINAVVY